MGILSPSQEAGRKKHGLFLPRFLSKTFPGRWSGKNGLYNKTRVARGQGLRLPEDFMVLRGHAPDEYGPGACHRRRFRVWKGKTGTIEKKSLQRAWTGGAAVLTELHCAQGHESPGKDV